MPIRIQNQTFEWRIDDNGANLGFFDKATGTDYLQPVPRTSCASVKKGPWRADATHVALEGSRLTLAFPGNLSATLSLDIQPDFIVFTVLEATGDIDELAFINIPTTLEAVADQPFSAAAIALSLRSNVDELPGPQRHLWSAAYRRFGFKNARTGIVACSFGTMREAMKRMVACSPDVPHSPLCGPWAQDSALVTYSNVMESPTLENVNQWIDFCHTLGLKAIECNGTLDYGSYLPPPRLFPNGYDDVRKMVDKFHAAGILVGLHTMSFSIAKNCAWVTPVPDPRLAKERSYTLAQALDETADTIFLREDTSDLPNVISYLIRRSKTLQIDDELITYKVTKTDAPFAVLNCQRGACGTTPAPHSAGAMVHHLKECWGCFVPDGGSTLFSEVADKISDAVNICNFDFVYLDGLDGSHVIGGEDARWHYGAKFTFEVFRGLAHPVMMEMATFHHHLWYVRSKMQAWDHQKRAHKAYMARHVFSNDAARRMFLPLHLGWAALFPYTDQQTQQTFWDDVEYFWSKALATDANFTLQCLKPSALHNGAWLADLAPIIRCYEKLRQEKYFPDEIKKTVAETDREFRLCQLDGTYDFQPMQAERHAVKDVQTSRWSFCNRFEKQPVALRIQALPSVSSYDSTDAVVLTSFDKPGEFSDPGMEYALQNSGKIYETPSSAPGMTSSLTPAVPEAGAPVKTCGCFTAARRPGDNGLVQTSAPDDTYSLCDHFEREYRYHEASWTHLKTTFAAPFDLDARQGLGIWICGDGKGETLGIVLNARAYSALTMNFYLKIDFSGWRYFELLERSDTDFENSSWPFARTQYAVYRNPFYFANVVGMDIWMNDVPKGETVQVLLGPLKAMPLIQQPLMLPAISVNGKTITFPIALATGQYLEFYGGRMARIYEGNGNFLGTIPVDQQIPALAEGQNDIQFACAPDERPPHLAVTLFSKSQRTLGGAQAPEWGNGPNVAPNFGTSQIAPEPDIPPMVIDDFIAPN